MRGDRIAGVLCAWGGAGLWAVALAILEPATEPAKPWHELWAGNNSYWVRDIRGMAIVVAFAGLVLAFRGDGLRSALSAVGTVGWFAVDLWLDRIDVAGWPAAGTLATTAGAAVLATVLARRTGSARPGRAVLLLTASITAALVPLAGLIESPTDSEAGLTPASLAAGVLLALVTIGCALGAAPARDASRIVAATVVAVVAAGGLVLLRVLPPDGTSRFQLGMVLGALLLTGVVVTAWHPSPSAARRSLPGYAAFGLGALVGYPAAVMVALLLTAFVVPVAAPLTALAGNPPVNGADTDALYTLIGLLAGLAFGAPLAAAVRARRFVRQIV